VTRRVLPPLLIGLVVLLALSGGAPAATERACGDVAGSVQPPQDVRAVGVGCVAARRLARHHWRQSGRYDHCSLGKKACRLDGWRCTRRFFGNSGTRVRCTKGAARVRFFYGS
jgi:hypothetical protein